MSKEKALVSADYILQKFPGKGGWTYAEIPEVLQNKNNPFGWVRVRGSIDGYELKQYKLMPMGNGKLFLPVKAAIRKKIGKEAGDQVKVVLYADESPTEIPEDIMDCFNMESPEVLENFKALPDGQQKAYLDWVRDAKTEDTKVKRILSMMDRVRKRLGFYDKTE